MNFKKLLFPIISIVLAKLAFDSIILVQALDIAKFGIWINIIIALILNILITGIFAFVGFAYPTHKLFPTLYYKVTNPTLLSTIYKVLGVKYFKKLLMIFFWGKPKNRSKYFNGRRSGIENLIYQSKQSEFGHIMPLVVVSILSMFLVFKGLMLFAFTLMLINMLGNFYPVLLQRYHRLRIEKLKNLISENKIGN